jgi:hypothetical protein
MDLNKSKIIERLLSIPPYSLNSEEKSALLLEELRALTSFHAANCPAYRRMLERGYAWQNAAPQKISDLPFLPVPLFKRLKLQSVPDNEVLKVLTSSGTTSQQVSRIVLDRATAMFQTRALASIITSFIGPKRLPMVIIDSEAILKDRAAMSARGAGLVGLSNFGRDHFYALDANMRLNVAGLKAFAERHRDEPILLFGFTFMVWQYFSEELHRVGEKLDLNRGILIHSGGWKKLQSQAVTNDVFKTVLRETAGIERVHNFYGMVEQVGGIYMECENGHFHAPAVADIIIRNGSDGSVLPYGEEGLIQTLSVLPRSYPGHSLLTEDLGTIQGIDDCPCGRKGVRFTVRGRVPRAELRGCSDTHAFSQPEQIETGAVRQLLPHSTTATDLERICRPEFFEQLPLPAFDPLVIEFLDAVSVELLKLPSVKEMPEIGALGFWLRKSNITALVRSFTKTLAAGELVQPLGAVFHVAPSNVDTIFVYSWALALLAGNMNVVRVSQKTPPQLIILLNALSSVLAQARFEPIRLRNIALTYPHEERFNRYLSAHADGRIVWGGDQTVNLLRSIPAKPTAREISFADKISLSVINADAFVAMPAEESAKAIAGFYNDAFQFDQLACSSPLFVMFVGDKTKAAVASENFWAALSRYIQDKGRHEHAATAVDKSVSALEVVSMEYSAQWNRVPQASGIVVLNVPIQHAPALRIRRAGGFFVECRADDLRQISEVIQPNDQTLAYIGFSTDEMRAAAPNLTARGIARIVPVGQALNFSPVWDGYVLLNELTRRITVT